jgi:hypothetical protein
MLQWSARPWWEWVVFFLAVLGGGKTVIWDWIVSPLRQRAKIRGSVEELFVRPLGVARTAALKDTVSSAFDAEIGLRVFCYNKHTQHTYLKKWLLQVKVKGKKPYRIESTPLVNFGPHQHLDFHPWMPEDIRFFWKEPAKGWLFFRCPNTRAETLESAKLKLFAVDVDGRQHRLFSGRPMAFNVHGE